MKLNKLNFSLYAVESPKMYTLLFLVADGERQFAFDGHLTKMLYLFYTQ